MLDQPTTFLYLYHQLRVPSVVRTLKRKAGVTIVTEQLLADVFRVDDSLDSGSSTGPHITPHGEIEA